LLLITSISIENVNNAMPSEALVTVVVRHVADRIDVHHQRDRRDDHHHHRAQAVDHETDMGLQRPTWGRV
jgi:hypothetical protein